MPESDDYEPDEYEREADERWADKMWDLAVDYAYDPWKGQP
jgi:hypothetical protein